ncbi:hypothetical protein [Pseudomonas sp. Tri1]|uniref:hypothetical protein n=1 Tax=Pseudomonas sp. Tri1 TaxID=2823875 RepID=UPI001B33BBAA|nr:hypothetical protein [Pseudomonas sp. Tri1]
MEGFFRYQSRVHNENFLSSGNLRIGTLKEFRSLEHKRGISDEMEGKKEIVHTLSSIYDVDSPNPLDEKALSAFGMIESGTITNFQIVGGPTLVHVAELEDHFIFCMSSVKSYSLFDELEGSETCVEIENPQFFFRRLTYSLNNLVPVEFLGYTEVVYGSKSENFNGENFGFSPINRKSSEYSRQFEVRAIWKPIKNQDISPVIINDKKLRRYLARSIDINDQRASL